MAVREDLTELLAPYAGLFDAETIEAMALRILGAIVIILAGYLISRALQRFVIRCLKGSDDGAPEVIASYRKLVRAAVMIVAFGMALHTLGINLTHAFTAGGLMAVAVAVATKNVSENLIGGWILRQEQVIKRGDVLRMPSGERVKVKRIGGRVTTVRTKTEAELIVPNSYLVQNAVYNDTHGDALHRIEGHVGVAYSSDLKQVRQVLEQACEQLPWRTKLPQPKVLLGNFGASSVNYRIFVWIDDPWSEGALRSHLNEAIWWALKDARIEIAFPQLDVHLTKADESIT